MSVIQAKDLTKEYPRSPYEELNGFPWLPRMIDKVRALDAGQIGAYTPYPCGGDQSFLRIAGVDADALKAVITGGATDEQIAAWVKDHATPGVEARVEAQRANSYAPATGEMAGYLEHAKAELAKERPELDFSRAVNFPTLICIEEGHPIPSA